MHLFALLGRGQMSHWCCELMANDLSDNVLAGVLEANIRRFSGKVSVNGTFALPLHYVEGALRQRKA
jgi:hypothetical protein